MVSIPYRYALNNRMKKLRSMEIKVSIPYRYALNNPITGVVVDVAFLFQFLIGTL